MKKNIFLDCSIRSTLKWKIPPIDAKDKIIWHLDFGFETLEKPFQDLQQCSSLKLACDHFIETLYLQYEDQTDSAVIYKGQLMEKIPFEPSSYVEWQKEKGCEDSDMFPFFIRDLFSDYLDIVTANVPKVLEISLFFEVNPDLHPIYSSHLANPDAFPRFKVHSLKNRKNTSTALLLPAAKMVSKKALDSLIELGVAKGPYHILTEWEFLSHFEGLETVIYSPSSISEEGERILQGFVAAGGSKISTNV